MARIAARGGELTSHKQQWVENALRLDQVSAHDLMTPRTVVQSLDADQTIRSALTDKSGMVHSRVPVTEGGNLDRILGVVYRRELHDAFANGRGDAKLREFVHPLQFVPEAVKGPQLLDNFIRGKRHMVAVVDEYGGFEGIVTLEDVLECMLGTEIVDEHDVHVDMQEFARLQARERADDGPTEPAELLAPAPPAEPPRRREPVEGPRGER
jgi:CBS domain containing-hemolysin-like protein